MYIGRDLSLKNNRERLMDFSQNMSTMISVHVKVNFSHFGPTFIKYISTYEKRISLEPFRDSRSENPGGACSTGWG